MDLKPAIMVVDDEPQIGKILTLFLGKHNYKAIPFTSGKEAITYLKNNTIDLLLTDLQIPDKTAVSPANRDKTAVSPANRDKTAVSSANREITGIELAQQAKTLYPALPIIVMSGSADGKDRDEIFKLGADFIPKPFELADLLERIDSRIHPDTKTEY
jgi:DNA-binding response OmpR family regulator